MLLPRSRNDSRIFRAKEDEMRKILMAAAIGFGLVASSAPAHAEQEWVAVAAYGNSYYVGRGWSEESARDEALYDCESATGRTCSRRLSASVPTNTWFLVVVRCPNGMAAGGSRISFENAKTMAAQRRGYQSWACSTVDWGN